jgi:hypothetical protein
MFEQGAFMPTCFCKAGTKSFLKRVFAPKLIGKTDPIRLVAFEQPECHVKRTHPHPKKTLRKVSECLPASGGCSL